MRLLYFVPLVVLVLGLVFLGLAYNPGPVTSYTASQELYWNTGSILIALGFLEGIIALGVYLWRARAAKLPK